MRLRRRIVTGGSVSRLRSPVSSIMSVTCRRRRSTGSTRLSRLPRKGGGAEGDSASFYAGLVNQLIENEGMAVGSLAALSARFPLMFVVPPAISDTAWSKMTQLHVENLGLAELNPSAGAVIAPDICMLKSLSVTAPAVS